MERTSILLALLILTLALISTGVDLPNSLSITGKVIEPIPDITDLTPTMKTIGVYYTPEKKARQFHLTCADKACALAPGIGDNFCITNHECNPIRSLNYRKKPAHMGCRENRCLVVWGEGENECSTKADCASQLPKIRILEPTPEPKVEEPKIEKPILQPITLSQKIEEGSDSILTFIFRKMGFID